ncbi:MAG: SH3 domain-containing protein, partial [Gemmatimonas sp.]
RAARLEPLATDLQDRIGLLPAGARGGIADVPMIPVPALTALALLLWVLGWALAAMIALRSSRSLGEGSRRRRFAQASAWVLLLVAGTAGGLAWWGRRQLDASRLSVVVRPETMHVAPGTDADAMGGVATGDVVERMEQQGGWQRVQHADGRTGWLPSLRLVAVVTERSRRRSVGTVPTVVPVETLAR